MLYVVLIPHKLACEPEMCMKEESSELLLEFTRTWNYEKAAHQITDVQGRLLTSINLRTRTTSPFLNY